MDLILALVTLAQADAIPASIGAGLAAIGGGLGIGILGLGAAKGIGNIGGNATQAVARQPEAAGQIFLQMIISAALIEGFTFFAIIICSGGFGIGG